MRQPPAPTPPRGVGWPPRGGTTRGRGARRGAATRRWLTRRGGRSSRVQHHGRGQPSQHRQQRREHQQLGIAAVATGPPAGRVRRARRCGPGTAPAPRPPVPARRRPRRGRAPARWSSRAASTGWRAGCAVSSSHASRQHRSPHRPGLSRRTTPRAGGSCPSRPHPPPAPGSPARPWHRPGPRRGRRARRAGPATPRSARRLRSMVRVVGGARMAVCSSSVSAVGLTPSSSTRRSRSAAYAASAEAGRPDPTRPRHQDADQDLVEGVLVEGGLGEQRRACVVAGLERRLGAAAARLQLQPGQQRAVDLGPLGLGLVGQQRRPRQLERGGARGPGRAGRARGDPSAGVGDQLCEGIEVEPVGDQARRPRRCAAAARRRAPRATGSRAPAPARWGWRARRRARGARPAAPR